MQDNGYIEEYREAIRKGDIIAGHELIDELDNLIADKSDPRFRFDTEEADIRMGFIENCVRLTKSPFYNKPMRLMLWQKAFISAVYGFYMADDGTERFREILLMLARKGGKSEFCSALILTDFFIGGSGRDIVCSSNDDNQADILYQACDTMRQLIDPKNLDSWRNQKGLRCLYNNNKVFKISERVKNKEGRNIDLAIADETHELRDGVIINSIKQSQSLKPNPKFISITTEGFVQDGWLAKELIRMRRIIRGEIEDAASVRTLPWLYTQDSEAEVWNGNRENRLWMKSNPSLGIVKRYDYLEQQIAHARESKEDRAFVLTKDFNIPQLTSEAWLMSEDISYDSSFSIDWISGAVCVGGVDLAETTDTASAWILAIKPDDDRIYGVTMTWIPSSKLDPKLDDSQGGARYAEWQREGCLRVDDSGNYLDTTIVADWFYELYKKYRIRLYKCGYDVRFSKEWTDRMSDYGFDTEMVYQRPEVMSLPIRMVEKDLQCHRLMGLTSVSRWSFANCALKLDAKGYAMIAKIDGQASRRIDNAVSCVIAYEMLRRYQADLRRALVR